jgi:hypothetical protein
MALRYYTRISTCSTMTEAFADRAIASGFPLIHMGRRVLGNPKTECFIEGQRNIPLLLLKEVDAIALRLQMLLMTA